MHKPYQTHLINVSNISYEHIYNFRYGTVCCARALSNRSHAAKKNSTICRSCRSSKSAATEYLDHDLRGSDLFDVCNGFRQKGFSPRGVAVKGSGTYRLYAVVQAASIEREHRRKQNIYIHTTDVLYDILFCFGYTQLKRIVCLLYV